jgi:HlyD family secretion protein
MRAKGSVPRGATDPQRTTENFWACENSIAGRAASRTPFLDGLKLVPGMPVEAFIRTGERTMLSYLIKPLSDQARRAFREK